MFMQTHQIYPLHRDEKSFRKVNNKGKMRMKIEGRHHQVRAPLGVECGRQEAPARPKGEKKSLESVSQYCDCEENLFDDTNDLNEAVKSKKVTTTDKDFAFTDDPPLVQKECEKHQRISKSMPVRQVQSFIALYFRNGLYYKAFL